MPAEFVESRPGLDEQHHDDGYDHRQHHQGGKLRDSAEQGIRERIAPTGFMGRTVAHSLRSCFHEFSSQHISTAAGQEWEAFRRKIRSSRSPPGYAGSLGAKYGKSMTNIQNVPYLRVSAV